MKKNIYRIASLFSGCGGLDLGFMGGFSFYGKTFERHNSEIVFANDIDKDAVECYNSNDLLTDKGQHSCLLGDVREIDHKRIPDFDILIAGFPCQPFSNAGSRKGVNDDRGTLFEECERILQEKISLNRKPKAFVFENVRGILSSKMSDGTTVPEEIKRRMELLGFNVSIQLLRASDYGVPQNRYRVFIIGIDNVYPHFDFSILEKIIRENNIPSVSHGAKEKLLVGSLLHNMHSENLTDNEYWAFSKSTQDMIDLIGKCQHGSESLDFFKEGYQLANLPKIVFEGRSWKNISPEKLTPRFKKIYENPKKYHAPNFFRRFAFGEINGTIIASAQPENCGITHPVENRRYTVREIARIQSFPDEFKFSSIPLRARYRVIGNAVPPILGWVLAKAIINHISNNL